MNHSLLVLGIIISVNATNITNRITLNGSHSFIYICSVDDEKGDFFCRASYNNEEKKSVESLPFSYFIAGSLSINHAGLKISQMVKIQSTRFGISINPTQLLTYPT